MNAEHFLMQARLIDRKIRSKQEQIQYYQCLATSISSTFHPNGVVQSGRISSRQDMVLKILEAREELELIVEELLVSKKQIEEVLSRVPDETDRLILEMYYLAFLSWREIEAEMNRSARWLQLRRNAALEDVQRILDEDPEKYGGEE